MTAGNANGGRRQFCFFDLDGTLADTDPDIRRAWKAALSDELIGFAADCAWGKKEPMAYMDKLLGEWQAAGVQTVDAARAQHAQAVSARREEAAASAAKQPAAALDYEQREYKPEDFGDDFFYDVVKNYGGDQA